MLMHKKRDATHLKNYRPISFLSNIYKLFLKTFTIRLFHFSNQRSKLNSIQDHSLELYFCDALQHLETAIHNEVALITDFPHTIWKFIDKSEITQRNKHNSNRAGR